MLKAGFVTVPEGRTVSEFRKFGLGSSGVNQWVPLSGRAVCRGKQELVNRVTGQWTVGQVRRVMIPDSGGKAEGLREDKGRPAGSGGRAVNM